MSTCHEHGRRLRAGVPKSSYSPLASHDAVHLYTCITVLASHTRMHTCVQSFVDRLPTSTTCHCTLIFLDLMLRSPPPQNCSVTSHFALYTVSRHSCTSQFEIHILGYQTNSTSAGVCHPPQEMLGTLPLDRTLHSAHALSSRSSFSHLAPLITVAQNHTRTFHCARAAHRS